MRGSVRKRGSTWTWYLDAPPDPVTGKRRQASKGGFRTKRECQEALNETLTPAHLTAFYRFLLDHGRRDGGSLAAKTVRNIHGELHAALRDAVRWGHVAP
jgi:hypothetical protein